ncbi:MAG: hypothetical protein IPP25_15175 [Saprospiraceae bacterium]|nr:hypothetical protein [Candidatus Opimibacter skivensis]
MVRTPYQRHLPTRRSRCWCPHQQPPKSPAGGEDTVPAASPHPAKPLLVSSPTTTVMPAGGEDTRPAAPLKNPLHRSHFTYLKTLVGMVFKQYDGLYFTTATVLHWYPLFEHDDFKEIIISALRYCVNEKRAEVWAFVIMNTHIHLVWRILDPFELMSVQTTLLRYTSKVFLSTLKDQNDLTTLDIFRVDKIDRKYQIWKREALSIEIFTDKVLRQKINYIHNNMNKKGFDDLKYKYSTASYYATGEKTWDFVK